MGYTYTEVTGKDIYEAMVKDGFGALREAWFDSKDGKPQACILGTAAINLNIFPTTGGWEGVTVLPSADDILDNDEDGNIISLEDALGDIAQDIMSSFDETVDPEDLYQDYEISVDEPLPYSLWYNDVFLKEYPQDPDNKKTYVYGTWESALGMARDYLSVVWDNPMKVSKFDYTVDFPTLNTSPTLGI